MKDLNWRSALRRATVFTLIWLGIVYITGAIWPQRFGIELPEELPFLAVNAVFFFIIFAVFSAVTERRRARIVEQRQNMSKTTRATKSGKSTDDAEDGEGGPLKGRPNPNTSRKKARRRR